MSEKTRKKKDGEDKNKNNQRMREANDEPDQGNTLNKRENERKDAQNQE
jgi:hypothetical protein